MHNTPLHDRIALALKSRRQDGLLRTLAAPPRKSELDLSSNSYLALQDNALVQRRAQALAGRCLNGNGASRLIAQASPLYDILEKSIASWNKTETALVFTSGYAANLGVIAALCNRTTEIFSDRFNHASIIDGAVLARAHLNRYAHNDMADLRRRLAASRRREKIIITESVFSMDGDCAPLADICELARSYGCMVMIDEAHATGLFGSRGSGRIEACGVGSAVDIHMGTLSKAIAGLGGFVACGRACRDFLVNHARSLIYSTGLPHAVLAWNCAAIEHIRRHPDAGHALVKQAQWFRERIAQTGFLTGLSTTPIIPCIVGSNAQVLQLARYLQKSGIRAPAMRSPTVSAGSERIRLTLNSGVTQEQQEQVLAVLRLWKKKHG